ncbi:xanthine dehydrogenase family protein subunit M [Blastococcus sp. URHD0036]|uniref:FAD binding domain-containing protein n=1 Tax=Blastococcus sp. URHD0036 TaxID=1380356 RepID=UPI0004954DAA|nr:xanthine dehydrogenase family protein subunit M [Blastococcus sp. URHD0036]
MKPAPFAYAAPTTEDEVLDLLAEHGDEGKVIAGGQSLLPMLSMRLARPSVLIDLNGVAGLAGITEFDGGVAFGATTRERAAERSALVGDRLPVLAEALPLIGHEAIRNRGTIGGSIAHADASAELPAVAAVTDAQLVLRSRAGGERVLSAAEFFQGHYTTALADDELLTEVRIPGSPPGAGWAFTEVARRHGDFALVGVAAMVVLDDAGSVEAARLCLMGVADVPLRLPAVEASLAGQPVSADTVAAAATDAVAGLELASDVHGSGDFRRHLAEVTVRRALTTAADRAGAPA